jgi:preflagellin peptidase FlaK
MDILLLLVLIALIWVIIASVTDFRKREVPDWISYSLIIIGVVLNLIHAVAENNFLVLITPLIWFVVFFIIANIMYYSGQWGGGDAKLLMGLGIVFSRYPESLLKIFNPYFGSMPFPLIFLLNIVIFGSFYGIIWTIIIAIRNKKKSLISITTSITKNCF